MNYLELRKEVKTTMFWFLKYIAQPGKYRLYKEGTWCVWVHQDFRYGFADMNYLTNLDIYLCPDPNSDFIKKWSVKSERRLSEVVTEITKIIMNKNK